MSDAGRSSRVRRAIIGAGVALVALAVLGVFVGVHSFQSEKSQKNFAFGSRFCPDLTPRPSARHGCVPVGDAAMIYADVLSIDPDEHVVTIRFTVLLAASEFGENGLTTPEVLIVSGKDVATFPAGSNEGGSVDAPVELSRLPHECCRDVLDTNTSNRVTSYPFDKYDADLTVDLRAAPPGGAPTSLPRRVVLKYAVHGWRMSVEPSLPDQFVLHAERSGSTVFFAIFVMVMMWALTIGIVAMAIILSHVRHDIGPGVLGFLAAMLFAFPGIRNVLPGAPPLGSLNDYLAFFWCEGIVGVTLLVLTAMFLRREIRTFHARRAEPESAS